MSAVKKASTRATIMRGGPSKAFFFLDSDLPADAKQRTDFLLRAFGSPDIRQVDGMGGADPLTSKTAIIRASNMPGVDVEYTFGQVSITQPFVAIAWNCRTNASAASPALERRSNFILPIPVERSPENCSRLETSLTKLKWRAGRPSTFRSWTRATWQGSSARGRSVFAEMNCRRRSNRARTSLQPWKRFAPRSANSSACAVTGEKPTSATERTRK